MDKITNPTHLHKRRRKHWRGAVMVAVAVAAVVVAVVAAVAAVAVVTLAARGEGGRGGHRHLHHRTPVFASEFVEVTESRVPRRNLCPWHGQGQSLQSFHPPLVVHTKSDWSPT